VISDRATAYGLQRAQQAHIPTQILSPAEFATPVLYGEALQKLIDSYHPDLIILAGFMRILSAEFVAHYPGKILNIHPALLPNYKGLHTHARALAAKEKHHGSSVHIVTAELDDGPVIAQAQLNIEENDTPDSLKARVQALEHQLYPQVIQWFATNVLQYRDGKLWWQGKWLDKPRLIN
jgi:phosphoribosylglycinamide formyltransferase-1